MAMITIFKDLNDEFRINDEGDLELRDGNDETSTLVMADNLDDFIAWLTDENDKRRAREKANG